MQKLRRALVLGVLACDSSAPKAQEPAPVPAAPAAPAAPAIRVDLAAPVETLLRADWDDRGRAGVVVVKTGQFVDSLAALRAALPDLPAVARQDPRYVSQLAHALIQVTQGASECFLSARDVEAKLPKMLDPEDVFDRAEWDAVVMIQAPGAGDVSAPRWDGEALLVDCVATHGPDLYTGSRYRFTLGADAWAVAREDVPTRMHTPERARTAVFAGFGGEVLGFVRVPVEGGALFLAIGPGKGAQRYWWRPTRGEARRFATWAELRGAVDAVAAPAAVAALVDGVHGALSRRRVTSDNVRVIADPAAYREEYRKNGHGTFKLRYHVDEVATTEYTVKDFDAIAAPAIAGERVVAYLSDGRQQPHRFEIDLSTLGWDSEMKVVALFEERVVSDTGTLFGGPKGMLEPAQPDPQRPRPLPLEPGR